MQKRVGLFSLVIFFCLCLNAQDIIPVSDIQQHLYIRLHAWDGKNFGKKNFSEQHHIHFIIANNSNSETSLFFTAGEKMDYQLLLNDGGVWKSAPRTKIDFYAVYPNQFEVSLIKIPAKKKILVWLQPDIHYYNFHSLQPALIRPVFINNFLSGLFIRESLSYLLISNFLCGMLIIFLFYAAWKVIENKKNVFVYNFLYILTFLLYYIYFFAEAVSYSSFLERYHILVTYSLQMIGHVFQIIFISSFLELQKTAPLLHKLMRLLRNACIISALLIIGFSTDNLFFLQSIVFTAIRIILLGFMLYFMAAIYRKKLYAARYIVLGLCALFAGGATAFLFDTVLQKNEFLIKPIGGVHAIFLAGIVLEIMIFRIGLGQLERVAKQNKIKAIEILKRETVTKDYQHKIQVLKSKEEERTRIAKEMHDDIGSTLTSIKLLSEVAILKPDNKTDLQKICYYSNNLIVSMNEIIWSMNNKNDHLHNLISYIRSYAVEYFNHVPVSLNMYMPEDIPETEIHGEARRNIFLVCKEAFHNIVKHAKATEVYTRIEVNHSLVITIKDNGLGLNMQTRKAYSNGLRNMQERMETINGSFNILSVEGTTVRLEYNLSSKSN